MKNILYLLIVFLSFSCSQEFDFNGRWVILKILHNDELIYPNTIYGSSIVKINASDYSDAETIDFITKDSVVILPGFNSSEVKAGFTVNDKKITFKYLPYFINENFIGSDSLIRAVFIKDFELVPFPTKENIGFKSENTTIELVRESYLIRNKIEQTLNF